MATIQNNLLLHGASGLFGNLLVFKNVRGKTIVTPRPKPPSKESAQQRSNRLKFKDAARFAKEVMLNPERKEYYRRKAKKLKLPNAYTAALTDYMRKVTVYAEVKDTRNGKEVVVSASKKGFNVHNIIAQQLDRAGNVVHNNITPLSSIPGLWRFSASLDAVFMFTLIDDTGQAVQLRMR